jgi:prepilin-type N-terminal cleavage/methylation domain-containing protein
MRPHATPNREDPPPSARRAFTLIETLVVIAIIAVIVAITIPILSKARNHAKVTASLATLQQLTVAMQTYGSSSREFFPYIGTPGNPLGPLVVNGFDLQANVNGSPGYFRVNSRFWISLLYPEYLSSRKSVTNDSTRVADSLSEYPEDVFTTDILLAHGCSAYATYWDTDDAPIDDTLLRGSTLGDVRFPSLKGLTFDGTSGNYLNKPGPNSNPVFYTAGRADGSAGLIDLANIPAEILPVDRPYGAVEFPILSTRHGLAGRDF